MSPYASQTGTMPQTASTNAAKISEFLTRRDIDTNSRLPSKRKRETICGLGGFTKPFTIKPCPETPYDKPYTFKPIRIIGRSQLPLSFLDTSNEGDFAANRLFAANIDVLEKHGETQNKENDIPKVLIARYETRRTMYAVERVQARVYSICKLASWLKEKEVTELWAPDSLENYPKLAKTDNMMTVAGEWWQHAMVEAHPAERPTKRIRMSMVRPRMQHRPAEQKSTERRLDEAPQEQQQPTELSAEIVPNIMEIPTLPSPQEQLEGLVDQYLNAIYMSKTSLAYFAKGPISRIRNAFTSAEEGAPPTHELVTFLRSMLLSHKAEEKKYREKLPVVIKALSPGGYSDEELVDASVKPKRTKKKMKLNREGMYPQEAGVVRKWWIGEMPGADARGGETIDQRIKRRLADLRVREALAQMILMLEITSLEALSTYKAPPDDDGEAAEETQTTGETQLKPKKRKKKVADVNLLLDLLLDKLCIWQSVEQEGVLDFDAKALKQSESVGESGQSTGNDRLQSFCVEVIVPFYMNRLPEQARLVNKKLGGPANTSPPKRKAMRPPVTSRKSGEPKEPEAKKSRRTLGRVATDTTGQTGQQRLPSLSRSNTDSALINGIKREGSEVPLSAIPFQRSPSQAARQSLSHFKHLKGREIDLNTTSAAASAKLKQKKRVEEDLKEAITALKKPNRGLAAGTYIDDIEKRGIGLQTKSRKPMTTVRKIIKDVQVSATPRAGRRVKEMVEQSPIHPRNPFVRPREYDAPLSSDLCIPSSAARLPSSMVPATVQRSATARTLTGRGVAETPSRPPMSKTFLAAATTNRSIFATPSKHRALSPDSPGVGLDATPTKSIASSPPINVTGRATPCALFATPIKETVPASVTGYSLPAVSKTAENEEEACIYDALGWNDDEFV